MSTMLAAELLVHTGALTEGASPHKLAAHAGLAHSGLKLRRGHGDRAPVLDRTLMVRRTVAAARELLADLAHELRTPLATLDSFLEGIQDGVVPTTADTWDTMREQTTRMRCLVADVDAVSRDEERQLNLRPHPIDINDVAADAVRAAAAAFADPRPSPPRRPHRHQRRPTPRRHVHPDPAPTPGPLAAASRYSRLVERR